YLTVMIFVRAATILPIFIASIITIFYYKRKRIYILGKSIESLGLLVIVIGVIVFWDYIGTFGLIESPELYFTSRYEVLLGENAQVGQKSIISSTNLAFFF